MSQPFHSYVYTQKNRKYIFKQKLMCNVPDSITDNSQWWVETTHVSISRWMDNKNEHIHTVECYSVIKRSEHHLCFSRCTLQHRWTSNMWCRVKEVRHKRSHVATPFIWSTHRWIHRDRKQINACQCLGRGNGLIAEKLWSFPLRWRECLATRWRWGLQNLATLLNATDVYTLYMVHFTLCEFQLG